MNEGDRVEKFTGEARWFGTILRSYRNSGGSIRFVVEVETPGKFQMVCTPAQLRPAPFDPDWALMIGYTNWKGDYSRRYIAPCYTWFGATEWHPEPQWLLHAWDFDRNDYRDFAMVSFKTDF